MAIELVTVKARTRGKSPVEFQYQGVGKITPRKVKDKDNQDIVLVTITVDDKAGKAGRLRYDKDGKLIASEKHALTQAEIFPLFSQQAIVASSSMTLTRLD
jgi:hypothetical protein